MADHGTRTRYVTGCRCDRCRKANTDYRREQDRHQARVRYGIEPPRPARHVDNSEARQHLEWLRSHGIGLRTVAAVTGLSRSALHKIASGQRTTSTPRVVNRILAVGRDRTPANTRVDASEARRMLDELVAAGHTKASIARRLGYRREAVQFATGDHITIRNLRRLQVLHRALKETTRA